MKVVGIKVKISLALIMKAPKVVIIPPIPVYIESARKTPLVSKYKLLLKEILFGYTQETPISSSPYLLTFLKPKIRKNEVIL